MMTDIRVDARAEQAPEMGLPLRIQQLHRSHRRLLFSNLVVAALFASMIPFDSFREFVGIVQLQEESTHDKGIATIFAVEWLLALAVCVLACGSAISAVLWLYGCYRPGIEARYRRLRISSIAVGGSVFVLSMTVESMLNDGPATPRALLFSVLFTGYALVMLRCSQTHHKTPWSMIALAFAGGAFVTTFAGEWNDGWRYGLLLFHPSQVAYGVGLGFGAALDEELIKGFVVVMLFALFKDRIDDIVSGVAIGSVVGLGFNLQETLQYATPSPGATHYQLWIRQTLGAPVGHITFTALVGAACAIACTRADRSDKVRVVLCGFLAAWLGHFIWDALVLSGGLNFTDSFNPAVGVFVVTPLFKALINGPFVLLVIALLMIGRKQQAVGMRDELAIELESGRGAVSWQDVPLLLNQSTRLRARFDERKQHGWVASRRAEKLRRAQIDLLMWRWRARSQGQLGMDHEMRLRSHVLLLKQADS